MSLDITVKVQRPIICPHCGDIVDYETIKETNSGGSVWYNYLESVGYYVPFEKKLNGAGVEDKYGEDMILSEAQIELMKKYIQGHDIYYGNTIFNTISEAQIDGDDVVINADW